MIAGGNKERLDLQGFVSHSEIMDQMNKFSQFCKYIKNIVKDSYFILFALYTAPYIHLWCPDFFIERNSFCTV